MAEKIVIGNAELWHGDCREVMESFNNINITCIATDPPYGISYVSSWRKQGKTEMLRNDNDAPTDAVPSMAKILSDGGALYLATRFDASYPWVTAMRDAGLTLKTPIFWDKGNHTSGDLEGDFGAQVEIFLFAHKGRHKLRGPRLNNLWRIPRDPAGDHPTPKPVLLMEKMITTSTDTGDVVMDPFMGSGSTGVASVATGRTFIGIEIDRKYFDICCERIDRAQAQERLFA